MTVVTAFVVALLLLLAGDARCGTSSPMNVLAVLPTPGKSHWNVMSAVLRALVDRGHNVTVFTPFADDSGGGGGHRDNYVEVDLSGADDMRHGVGLDLVYLIENVGTAATVMNTLANFTRRSCDVVFGHPRMAEILKRGRGGGFDVFVVEPMASECVAYPAAVLGVPLVYVFPPPIVAHLERTVSGHAPEPAAVSHVLSSGGTPAFAFAARLANALLTVYCTSLAWYYDWLYRTADPRPYDAVPPVKPSVTFVNTHFITEPSRPFAPNIVQIGGIHLARPGRIPEDILEFIENSPHGVIYFTFGSTVAMTTLPERVQNAFKEAFAQVPQRVLWKYEGEMRDKPANVMTKNWFPQRDVLLHPNVRLFVSHGGISGVYEAVDAGVPMLGFPFFYDQPRNVRSLADAGMAVSMDLSSVDKDTFLAAVLELVNDEKYRENARIASELFKDRPMTPAESVVYWTEYVVRHKGAPHLKYSAIDLAWYEYWLVDVMAALLSTAAVVSFAIYYVLRAMRTCAFEYFRNAKPKRE